MASKKALLGGTTLKVENVSGFDKSRYNAFTAPLGAIVPMVKQLLLPGKAKCSVKISAQLPPLASDAFLRTHLKVEAFFVPLRLCYGGFQSFFSGEKVADSANSTPATTLHTAKLPRLSVIGAVNPASGDPSVASQSCFDAVFGPHTLMDYFGVRYPIDSYGHVVIPDWAPVTSDPTSWPTYPHSHFNIFPFVAYQLCYDHWYRNKLVERQLFAPPSFSDFSSSIANAGYLPFMATGSIKSFFVYCDTSHEGSDSSYGFPYWAAFVRLFNGHLLELRQRNYGFDYFTTSYPSAQDGSPMTVDTSSGSFTISSLRTANALQHFAEVNQVSGPDYVQTLRARYGKAPGSSVVQKPVLLGSADFPMFTSGVEQSAPFDSSSRQTSNPFEGVAARYGRAHAEGSDFVCECDVDEPGYLMVMASVVPEANYANGVSHDMRMFTEEGSIVDLPCAELERIGFEPVYREELSIDDSEEGLGNRAIFGYQPRYMWHKAGSTNEVHGLFRQGCSLQSFIPQRYGFVNLASLPSLNADFLKVKPDDLDNVMAVSASLSEYGVMIDSAVSLFVSESLGESTMPSLVDPASEHGHSVYVKNGGISVND